MDHNRGGPIALGCFVLDPFRPRKSFGPNCAIANLAGSSSSGKCLLDLTLQILCAGNERVVVEVDGGTHSTEEEIASDRKRTADLQCLGYRVFRVHNVEVFENIDGVLDSLLAFLEETSS